MANVGLTEGSMTTGPKKTSRYPILIVVLVDSLASQRAPTSDWPRCSVFGAPVDAWRVGRGQRRPQIRGPSLDRRRVGLGRQATVSRSGAGWLGPVRVLLRRRTTKSKRPWWSARRCWCRHRWTVSATLDLLSIEEAVQYAEADSIRSASLGSPGSGKAMWHWMTFIA